MWTGSAKVTYANAVASSRGYIPTSNPVPTQGIGFYGDAFVSGPASGSPTLISIGTLVVSYYIVARSRN
jgi:hypothetical protein